MNINLLNSFVEKNELEFDISDEIDIYDIMNPYVGIIYAIKLETEGKYRQVIDLTDHIGSLTDDTFTTLATKIIQVFVQVRINLNDKIQLQIERLNSELHDYRNSNSGSMNGLEMYNFHYLSAIFYTVVSTFAFYQSDYQKAIDANEMAISQWEAIGEDDGINLVKIDMIFCYNRTGRYNESIHVSDQLLEDVDKHQDPLTYCHILISRGEILKLQGNYTKAIPIFEEALELSQKLDNQPEIYHSSRFLAEMYSNQGLYEYALLLQQDVLSYFQTSDNSHFISLVLNGLGNTSRLTGDYQLAEHYLFQSISYSKKIGTYDEILNSYYNLLLIELHKEIISEERINNYRNKIYENIAKVEDPRYQFLSELCEYIIKYYSDRLESKFEAMRHLRDLIFDEDCYYEYRLTGIYYQIDLLLMEFNYTKNVEILKDVNQTIDLLIQIGHKMHSIPIIIDYYLLQAKFLQLQGKKQEVVLLLDKAYEIAVSNNKDDLVKYIRSEQDLIEQQDKVVNPLFNPEITIVDQFRPITKYVRDLQVGKIPQLQIFDFHPLLIMVISSGGMSLYTKEFETTLLSESSLVASFLTAIMSFSQEAFSNKASIELIKIGPNNLVLQKLDTLIVCFMFTGNTTRALATLDNFIDEVKGREMIVGQLKKNSLSKTDTQFLDHITETIFKY